MLSKRKTLVLAVIILTLAFTSAFGYAAETKTEASNSVSNSQSTEVTPEDLNNNTTDKEIVTDQVVGNEDTEEMIEEITRPVPAYTVSQVKRINLTKPSGVTAKELARASRFKTLRGLYDDFIRAEEKYNVNAVFLMSLSIVESSGGKYMYRKNNMFGYGGKSYSSKSACIDDVAKGISRNYLNPKGKYYNGKTIGAVNKIYCTSKSWTNKVATHMSYIYQDIHQQQVSQ